MQAQAHMTSENRRRPWKPTVAALAAAAVLAVLAAAPVQAGQVSVSFVDPQQFTDIGFGKVPRDRNLQTLHEHMMRWGQRLPQAQSLQIEVLDVDLAGIERPVGFDPFVRVLNGRVDGPRMTLRWMLREGDTVVASGRDELSDMSYLQRLAGVFRNEPLFYDRRMLDDWLRSRIIERTASR